MEFLAAVLETPAQHAAPAWQAEEPVTVVAEPVVAKAGARRRRKRLALVPEAA